MRQRWFTIAIILASSMAAPAAARADRVVVLAARGQAPEARLQQVDIALVVAVRAVGDEPVSEPVTPGTRSEAPPATANEMRAIAEVQGAQWTLVPEVREEQGGGGYWLTLKAGYAPGMRVEVVSSEVRDSREAARLEEILSVLLRPQGIGDDAARVSGEDEAARAAEGQAAGEKKAQAEQAKKEAAQQAKERQAFEQREKQRKLEEQRRAKAEAQKRWNERERYGATAPWLVQLGLGVRPIVSHPAGGTGGTLGAIEARAGRSFHELPGLEARAGLDLIFGASTAFALYGGAAYLYSFFADVPVFLGASLELGLFQPLTGARHPSFMLRGAPTASWHFAGSWFLEAALPEVMWLTAGGGSVTIGMSARLGLRF